MSNTFKYLDGDKSQQTNDDAAQSFLNEKLAKNKYTIQQQDALDASGGPTVANASDGATPEGEAYAPPAATFTDAGDQSRYDGVGSDDKSFGNWNTEWDTSASQQQLKASGALNPESELSKQFASLNADGGSRVDDGEGWKELAFDEDVKTAEQYEAQVKQWQDAGYDVRAIDMKPGDYSHSNIAVREGTMQADAAPKEKKAEPIEHSPEIKQAKERVKSYEDDILSGKTSEDIYGSGSNYTFDADKGAAGIGTPMNGDPSQQASKATASFLDKKVFDVKSKQQFQPTS
jgi:hypothetical protein